MFEIVAMWTTGENEVDILDETFLVIREEHKSFVDKRLECMALNDSQKQLKKPKHFRDFQHWQQHEQEETDNPEHQLQ